MCLVLSGPRLFANVISRRYKQAKSNGLSWIDIIFHDTVYLCLLCVLY